MKNFHSGFSIMEFATMLFAFALLSLMIYGHTKDGTGGGNENAVINNLRILKTAALVFHEQSPDVTPSIKEIIECAGGGEYKGFNFVESNGENFLIYEKDDEQGKIIPENTKKKLTARAESVGLLGSANNRTATTEKYNMHDAIGMKVW